MVLISIENWVLGLLIACLPHAPANSDCGSTAIPKTAKVYLQEFAAFAQDVNTDCGQYAPEELICIDLRFKQLRRDWYLLFAQALTPEERVKVLAYSGTYYSCRSQTAGPAFIYELEQMLWQPLRASEPDTCGILISSSPQKQ